MFINQSFKKGLILLMLIVSLLYFTKDALCDEISSNCLSYPVIYSNGVMTPRGTYLEEMFDGQYEIEYINDNDFILWYYQQDPLNEWQAESIHHGGLVDVDLVDWGDNLESRPWTTNSIVRLETTFYKFVEQPMTGYEMAHIYGLGTDEMWGTNGVTYDEYFPTVYASDAQITIQYIPWNTQVLEWDRFTRTWIDPEYFPVVMDEPFSAEINVKGKVIHGCSWNVRTTARQTGAGLYRITMSFPMNTKTDLGFAKIMTSAEGLAESEEPQGGTAAVDPDNNLTYIDVPIIASNGSGSGGNGGKGGGGKTGSAKGRNKN